MAGGELFRLIRPWPCGFNFQFMIGTPMKNMISNVQRSFKFRILFTHDLLLKKPWFHGYSEGKCIFHSRIMIQLVVFCKIKQQDCIWTWKSPFKACLFTMEFAQINAVSVVIHHWMNGLASNKRQGIVTRGKVVGVSKCKVHQQKLTKCS